MADNGVVYTTKLRQVFPKTELIETGDVHNLEMRLRRRRVTRIGGRQESDQLMDELEENVYIHPSIFLCFDDLAKELNTTLCGRLDLNLDGGTINGLAEVVYHNLRGGVCDEVQRTVVVVIVEVEEVEDLPGDDVEDDYEYPEEEYVDTEEEVVEEGMVLLLTDVVSNDLELDDPCAICWDVFAAGTGALKLPCGHLFHDACIRAWLARKWNCPMCRKEIKVD
ncbi:unnamed protein product [Rhodiola kirilowii]